MTFDTITTLFPWLLPVGSFFLVIFLLLLLVVVVSAQQNRQYLRQQEALQSFVFPQTYMDDVKLRYPHLTEADLAIAFEELRLYFSLCWNKQPKTVVMPSRLVDVCWHVFIIDTRQYQQFCEDVYGQLLHHMPRVEVDLPQPEEQNEQAQADDGDVAKEAKKRRLAIKAQELDAARVYHWAMALQKLVLDDHQVSTDASMNMLVPLLFTIDQDLRIPDGYFYPPEVLQFLATYDLKAAEAAMAGLDSVAGGSVGMGCGDGGSAVGCGGCGGST